MRQAMAGGVLLAAAFGLVAGGAAAETFDRYTSFWAFGDSLTDDGNLSAATGGAAPGAPYFEGRFSNGPVWAEHIAEDFTNAGKTAENFAYGGAAVGPAPLRPLPAPPVVDLDGQVGLFAEASPGRLGARPLASLWFGSNDLLFNGVPNGDAKKVGRAAARGVASGALELRDLGVRDVILFNLPALEKTPNYRIINPGGAEQARKGTRAFNRTLARRADGLREAGMRVTEIDVFALFNELLDDPVKFGVVDARTPCYLPGVVFCGDTLAPLLAFFDPVHPNATIHAAVADAVRAEVAPVPLPAPALLLVGGLAALGLVRLQRQGSRIA